MLIGPSIKRMRKQTRIEALEQKLHRALYVIQECEVTLKHYAAYEKNFANAPGWAAKTVAKIVQVIQ